MTPKEIPTVSEATWIRERRRDRISILLFAVAMVALAAILSGYLT